MRNCLCVPCCFISFIFSLLTSFEQDHPLHLAVFYETVRLWPGLPKNGRLATRDDVLPAVPHRHLPEVKINKGEYVFWSDFIIMHDRGVSSQADLQVCQI